MLQITLTQPFTLSASDVQKPRPAAGQALLKVHAVGICGSDIQMYHGRHKFMTYPVIIGHEVSATVEELGPNVTGYAVGDKVTVEPQAVCGECYPCSIGRFNVCEKLTVMGVHGDGFCREYAAVDVSYLHKCPKTMKQKWLALVEPVAVGVGAVKRASEYAGAHIAVVGAGTIGNCVAQAARALGAGKVLVADVSPAKLDLAKRCGIEYCADVSKTPLAQAIREVFGPRRADVIIDAAGVPSSMAAILDAARPTSCVVITGNYKEPVSLEIPRIQRQAISLIGHMMYVREDFADAIRFMDTGAIVVEELITQRFPAAQLKDAFEFIDAHPGSVTKALIEF